MDRRQHEIEQEEKLCGFGVGLREEEVQPRHEMLLVLLVVFEALQTFEQEAQERRQKEQENDPPLAPELGGADRERHEEAAGEEDRGIDAADEDLRVATGLGEP